MNMMTSILITSTFLNVAIYNQHLYIEFLYHSLFARASPMYGQFQKRGKVLTDKLVKKTLVRYYFYMHAIV